MARRNSVCAIREICVPAVVGLRLAFHEAALAAVAAVLVLGQEDADAALRAGPAGAHQFATLDLVQLGSFASHLQAPFLAALAGLAVSVFSPSAAAAGATFLGFSM